MYKIESTDALIIVDPQNDFCPGGALAVEGGHEIMEPINALAERFFAVGAPIVFTQDYHPADHKSFASNHNGAAPFSMIAMPYGPQVLWPDHCIQGSAMTDFEPVIADGALKRASLIIRKGMNPAVDSYSAFFENDKVTSTGLSGYLLARGVKRLFIVGLAYDFCVGFSAIDGKQFFDDVIVLKDLTRAIDMPTQTGTSVGDIEQAFAEGGIVVASALDDTRLGLPAEEVAAIRREVIDRVLSAAKGAK